LTRFLTHGQYVAWRGLRLIGRVLFFGTLTLAAVIAILALFGCNASAQDRAQERPSSPFLKDKPVIALWAADNLAQTLDYRATRWSITHGGRELNPFTRPFVHSPALYVEGQAELALTAYLGHRMRNSKHACVRKFWWLPQTITFAQNVSGWQFTRRKR